tara:strand:- start:214 stop:1344 length:1131 start_codon:yes stop_codon:yes gene_type:complete
MADYSLALNAGVTSGKQFAVYVAADATVGAEGITASSGANAYRLDTEGITLPTFSPNQEFEMRSGAGRVAEFGAIFSSSKRTMTEVSLSGRVTMQDLPILMENILCQEASTNLFAVTTASASQTFGFADGAAVGTTVFSKSLSLYFAAPTAADSYVLPGCVCTSLTLDADIGTAGGRYNYSATFQTQCVPAKGAITISSANELSTTLGSESAYLSEQSTKDLNIMAAGGADFTSINPILSTFSLSIENPSQFLGANGVNAEPDVYARAVPELSITISGSLKYDNETDSMIEAFRDSGNNSYIQLVLNNKAITSNLENLDAIAIPAHSTQEFGLIVPQAKLTSCEVSSDDTAMINFEAKVLDPGSNKIIHIATGATA